MRLEFSRQFFKKHSNIKFHKNPSIRSPVVPCGRTDGRTEMTKLIVAFRNFANTPKIVHKGLFTLKREIFLLYLHSSANFVISFSYIYALPSFLHISLHLFPFVHLVVIPVFSLADSDRCFFETAM